MKASLEYRGVKCRIRSVALPLHCGEIYGLCSQCITLTYYVDVCTPASLPTFSIWLLYSAMTPRMSVRCEGLRSKEHTTDSYRQGRGASVQIMKRYSVINH